MGCASRIERILLSILRDTGFELEGARMQKDSNLMENAGSDGCEQLL